MFYIDKRSNLLAFELLHVTTKLHMSAIVSLLLLSLISYACATGPLCHICDDVLTPSDCPNVMTCQDHEQCFVQKLRAPTHREYFKLGCISRNKCLHNQTTHVQPVGRRDEHGSRDSDNMTAYDVTLLVRGARANPGDSVLCSECANDANDQLGKCGSSPHNDLRCLHCSEVSNPHDCDSVVNCGEDEQCFIGLQPSSLHNGALVFTMGCQRNMTCKALSVVTHVAYCLECCATSYCNDIKLCNVSATKTTTHAPTAATTSLPWNYRPVVTIVGPVLAEYNTSVTLTCQTDVHVESYIWTLDAHQLTTARSPTLTIPALNANSTGTYRCTAIRNGQYGYADHTVRIKSNINECTQSPCKNGATCTNLLNAYSCTCSPGWQGTNCDQDTNGCAPAPCKNGATCSNLQNSFSCTCVPGWQGTNCDKDVDECAIIPCKKGATCNNLLNAYSCTCSAGWQGTNCDQGINECAHAPCKNGATCNNLLNAYSCTCAPGWQGTNCDQDINECAPAACKNSATCNNLLNAYSCTCSPGWQGTNCDQDINECAPAPCTNGATCNNLLNAYSCTCSPGWQGYNCDQVPRGCSDAVKHNAETYHGATLFQDTTCLELVKYVMDWKRAETDCASRGGHLADILSQRDEDMVISLLHSNHVMGNVWIGLNDINHEGTFVWSSGHQLIYSNWITELSITHAIDDCVVLMPDHTPLGIVHLKERWNDIPCSSNNAFICRYGNNYATKTTEQTAATTTLPGNHIPVVTIVGPASADYNTSITMTCQTDVHVESYLWTLNGHHLMTTLRSSTLTIPVLNAKSTGTYRCTAITIGQSGYADHIVRIKSKAAHVISFTKQKDPQSGAVTFTCVYEGYPLPIIDWSFAGVSGTHLATDVHINDARTFGIIYSYKSVLHDGNYTCGAKNFFGGDSKTVTLP